MTDSTPAQPDRTLALASEVERLRRALEGVKESVATANRTAGRAKDRADDTATQVTEQLAALRVQLKQIGEELRSLAAAGGGQDQDDEPLVVRSWFDLGPVEAVDVLVGVAKWLHDIGTQYPQLRELAECWHRHPYAVDALLALHATWHAAYRDPDAKPYMSADWHIRYLPSIAELVRRLESCTELDHRPEAQSDSRSSEVIRPRGAFDARKFDEYASWWAGGRKGDEPGLPDAPPESAGYGDHRPVSY